MCVCIVYQFTFDIINVRYPFLFVVFNQLGCKRVMGASHSPTTCILQYSSCILITACPDSSLCHSSVPTCTIVVWTVANFKQISHIIAQRLTQNIHHQPPERKRCAKGQQSTMICLKRRNWATVIQAIIKTILKATLAELPRVGLEHIVFKFPCTCRYSLQLKQHRTVLNKINTHCVRLLDFTLFMFYENL